MRICLLIFGVCGLLGAVTPAEIPAGTEIHVRLTDKVASNFSKAKQPVRAVLIAPIVIDDRIVIPSGAELRGAVTTASAASEKERASLGLAFSDLKVGKDTAKLAAKIVSVDNARESVDETTGKVLGIIGSATLAARIDQGINKLSQRYGGLAEVLQATKSIAGVKEAEPDIVYEPGTEMTLTLTKPLQIKSPSEGNLASVQSFSSEETLAELANKQPFLTYAAKPPRPSDMTNVMFIGTQKELEDAFTAAGWSTADALNAQSKMETVRAVIEQRGYKDAPVSTLLLDGSPPDLVYQKMNNTFAQRHHLRIWQRPGNFEGQPIWVCAATHDIAIDFSERDHTFIHKIDPEIDKERAKVVNDLLYTGKVKSLALVDRPEVPHDAENATGDKLITDGKMAVLRF